MRFLDTLRDTGRVFHVDTHGHATPTDTYAPELARDATNEQLTGSATALTHWHIANPAAIDTPGLYAAIPIIDTSHIYSDPEPIGWTLIVTDEQE